VLYPHSLKSYRPFTAMLIWSFFFDFYARQHAGTAIARLNHRNSVRCCCCDSPPTLLFLSETIQDEFCPSVCLSVRLSHGWISEKRCKLELPNFHRRLPEDSSFRNRKAFPSIQRGVNPNEGAKWQVGGQNLRFLANKSLYLNNGAIGPSYY